MLNLKEPALADEEWIRPILEKSKVISADGAFGSMYVWKDAYKLKVAHSDGFLFRFYEKENGYGFPIGIDDIKKAVESLCEDAEKRGTKLRFIGITQGQANLLDEVMPGKFTFLHDRKKDEYIYKAADLAGLCGKRYHSKRNHISKFSRDFKWSYESLTSGNISDCEELAKRFFNEKESHGSNALEDEKNAIFSALLNFDKLNFFGGMIKVNGNPVAFTMGEKINDSVFVTHFEKALNGYREAYAVINNEFAKKLQGFDFINREEDLGIDGLRKAKLSYFPIAMLKKYEAVPKEEQ